RLVDAKLVEDLPDGQPCSLDASCDHGHCVDGVCCDVACGYGASDDCQACSGLAGNTSADGRCGPVAAGRVCRASRGACDPAESCDGVDTGACVADAVAPQGT